uniref:DEAD-box ATP-dependent RNA helicase 5 n=1 Tax=Noccaea caerulescens TaxID=107243 RepID=A0A1J3E6X5_NOCCA
MAKGDDALARKKNKLTRKKMSRKNDSATVSARIAALIAAKKRRKSGKRSMCQGMCFSLPSPDDPFNERQGKADMTKKKAKKLKSRSKRENKKKPSPIPMSIDIDGDEQEDSVEKKNGQMKYLMSCLNEIESSFRVDGGYSDDKSLFTSTWGIEFWKCFYSGKNVLETSGTSSTVEQIAWIVSTAIDAIARCERELPDESFSSSPFLLWLVPSQSKASKVRSVCKALKGQGVHAVSLHQGASINHQIDGLRVCEPEFLVSTPERLLEIVAMKGVDISGVSLLVIDELGSLCTSGYLDAVKSIEQAISGEHQTVVFNDSFSASYIPAVQSLLEGSVNRLALCDSVATQGSCIIQTVNVCASEEKKLEKFSEVVDSCSSKIIYIVTKEESFMKLKALLEIKGLSVSVNSEEIKKGRKPLARLIDIEQLDTTVMKDFETVLLPDFVPSLDTYVQILTSMARDSVRGVLHSFLTEKEAAKYPAGPLVKVLEDCGQSVPEPWRNM